MGTVLAIGALVLLVGCHLAYCNWLTNGIKPRTFRTRIPAGDLRQIFQEKVARAGWKIVDDGNPMVAQSSLATGVRQQISLDLVARDGHTVVQVGPQRWVTSWGVPKKGHTIRMRLASFVEAVRYRDRSIDVRVRELHGR